MKIHKISAEHLSIERIGEIVYGGYKIELSDDAHKRIVDCREYLDRKIAESTTPIYVSLLDLARFATLVSAPTIWLNYKSTL